MARISFRTNPVTFQKESFSISDLTIQEVRVIQHCLEIAAPMLLLADKIAHRPDENARLAANMAKVLHEVINSVVPKPAPQIPSDFTEASKNVILNDNEVLEKLAGLFNRDIDTVKAYVRSNDPIMGHVRTVELINKHYGFNLNNFMKMQHN